MKPNYRRWLTFLLFSSALGWAQQPVKEARFKTCTNELCRLKSAFLLSEYYLETDEIDKAQQWLEVAKEIQQGKPQDTTSYFIQSMQSELFYYMGLYQFGRQEAQKGIALATKLQNPTLLADAYFFRAINEYELGQYESAVSSLLQSEKKLPRSSTSRHMRSIVKEEYIYNNLAQTKLQLNELDSARYYNNRAYRLALAAHSRRGIPNSEQTFGLIHLRRKDFDSARTYLQRSLTSATDFRYFDIALMNYGYLMQSLTHDPAQVRAQYNSGLQLIARQPVNIAFQRLFYATALQAFKQIGDTKSVMSAQDKIIQIDAETRLNGNLYIQNISNQYVRNEGKLFSLRIQELNRQRNLVILELVAALLCMLVLLLIILFIRRKNRIQQVLLDQKNDISKDLHDDIGSGLSSILIHADLLQKTDASLEKQQQLAAKIEATGKEVSQRLSTFIWSLNNENNSVQSFCEYVKFYANRLLDGTEVTLDYVEEVSLVMQKTINGHDRKNLFFCIKEMLNNVLKHSAATGVRLEITADKKAMFITVHDNGHGLHQENKFGNGLKNIQKRIDSLHGTLAFSNEKGLRISISVPFSAN